MLIFLDSNINKAEQAYKEAVEKASGLASTHPIRLGLALNFSVFYFEIKESKEKACELAKTVWLMLKKCLFIRMWMMVYS